MALKEPLSMEECVYMTNRFVGEHGAIRCWVFKNKCPKCGKGTMGKPRGDNGKVKIRAKEYVCPDCNHTIEGKAYEESLTASIVYTCPKCKHNGEIQIPFKRKKMKIFDEETQKKVSVDTLQFACQKCSHLLNVTKKMK